MTPDPTLSTAAPTVSLSAPLPPLMCSNNLAFNNSVVARAFAVARLAIVSKGKLVLLMLVGVIILSIPLAVLIVSLAHSSSSSLSLLFGLLLLPLLDVMAVVVGPFTFRLSLRDCEDELLVAALALAVVVK